MKHTIPFFILLLICSDLFSQNVGIGTTTPAEKLHILGNLRVDGRSVFFGPNQRIYGDDASAFYFDGNHSVTTQLILRDAENVIYGRLYGYDDGNYFGLLDGDANWSYIAKKDAYTAFRIDDSEKMRINANGNVGIGTGSPPGKLTVKVDSAARGFEVHTSHGNTLLPWTNGWSYLAGQGIIFRTTGSNTEQMRISPNGNVGIGTTSSAGKLIVAVDSAARGFEVHNKYGNTHIPWTNGWSYLSGLGVIFRTDANVERMRIAINGNVGIGTSNPTSKLAVNGNVRSKEVLVELSNWPDYVFDAGYQLPTLLEEESFINEHGHLSGFKSEGEMEGTITVGDVTKRQQEKIEPIMLHLIEMEKANQVKADEMEVMEKKMEVMEDKLLELMDRNAELEKALEGE